MEATTPGTGTDGRDPAPVGQRRLVTLSHENGVALPELYGVTASVLEPDTPLPFPLTSDQVLSLSWSGVAGSVPQTFGSLSACAKVVCNRYRMSMKKAPRQAYNGLRCFRDPGWEVRCVLTCWGACSQGCAEEAV